MLVLDNEKIKTAVLGNGQILDAFPQFYAMRQKTVNVAGCSACQKNKKNAEALAAIDQVRQAIGRMSPADKQRLKDLLGATHVRIYWQDVVNGQVTRQRADF